MSSRSEVNHKTWPKGMPRRGSKYFRYLLRKNWFLILLWIFCFLIPTYHTQTSVIPSQENLQFVQGILSFEKRGTRSGTILVVDGRDGKEYYTCRDVAFAGHSCIYGTEMIKALTGKTVQIWWFEQNIYFGFSQHRVVRLVVDNQEKISIKETTKWNENAKKSTIFFSVLMLLFCILLVVLSERADIRKSKEELTHG